MESRADPAIPLPTRLIAAYLMAQCNPHKLLRHENIHLIGPTPQRTVESCSMNTQICGLREHKGACEEHVAVGARHLAIT